MGSDSRGVRHGSGLLDANRDGRVEQAVDRPVGDGGRLQGQAGHRLADSRRRVRGDNDHDRCTGLDLRRRRWRALRAVAARRQGHGRCGRNAGDGRQRTRGDAPRLAAAGRDGDGPKRLLERGRAQKLRLGRRARGEIAAIAAPAQVPVEQRRLEQGQNPIQPKRNRFTRTVAACGSHKR